MVLWCVAIEVDASRSNISYYSSLLSSLSVEISSNWEIFINKSNNPHQVANWWVSDWLTNYIVANYDHHYRNRNRFSYRVQLHHQKRKKLFHRSCDHTIAGEWDTGPSTFAFSNPKNDFFLIWMLLYSARQSFCIHLGAMHAHHCEPNARILNKLLRIWTTQSRRKRKRNINTKRLQIPTFIYRMNTKSRRQ